MAADWEIGDGKTYPTVALAVAAAKAALSPAGNLTGAGRQHFKVYPKAAGYQESVDFATGWSAASAANFLELEGMVPGITIDLGNAAVDKCIQATYFTKIHGLDFTATAHKAAVTNYAYYGLYANVKIYDCSFHDFDADANKIMYGLYSLNDPDYFWNLKIYNIGLGSNAGYGIYSATGGHAATHKFRANCTVWNCKTTGISGGNVNYVDYQNIYSGGSGSGVDWANQAVNVNGVMDYNTTSDATAPGTHALINKAGANQFVDLTLHSENFHLLQTADLNRAGLDESATFTTDYDGKTRYAWNTGALEYFGSEPLAGVIAAQSTLAGSLSVKRRVVGTISAVSLLAGSLSANLPISGAIAGQSAVEGTMSAQVPLAGTVQAQGGLVGSLSATVPLAGSVQAAGDLSGSLSAAVPLAGILEARSALDATARAKWALAGSLSAQSSLHGNITANPVLRGTIDATSTLEGSMLADVPLAGEMAAQSAVTGIMSASVPLAGSIASVSDIEGEEKTKKPLLGAVTSAGSLAGALSASLPLSGEIAAESSLEAALEVVVFLSGELAGQSELTGKLKAEAPLAGSIEAHGEIADATLNTARLLAGSISSASLVEGHLQIKGESESVRCQGRIVAKNSWSGHASALNSWKGRIIK
jgi:hypothetical protein